MTEQVPYAPMVAQLPPGRRRSTVTLVAIAVSCLIVIAVGVTVGVVVLADRKPALRNSAGTIVRPGSLPPARLRVGDCAELPAHLSGSVTKVSVLPCSALHNAQVVTIVRSTDATFPGDTAYTNEAINDCTSAVKTFLGSDPAPLYPAAFVGYAKGWQAGDHDERCVLIDRRKDIVGDIRADR